MNPTIERNANTALYMGLLYAFLMFCWFMVRDLATEGYRQVTA